MNNIEADEQRIRRLQGDLIERRAELNERKARFNGLKEDAKKAKPAPPTFQEFEAFAHLADIPPSQVRMVRLKMRLRDIANKR